MEEDELEAARVRAAAEKRDHGKKKRVVANRALVGCILVLDRQRKYTHILQIWRGYHSTLITLTHKQNM
jgi:hypothetical protein